MSYRVEVIERDGHTIIWVRTPEGLSIAPVSVGLINSEEYRAMMDDFAGAMQAARDRRNGAPVGRPEPRPATVEVWWDERGPTARERVFQTEGSPPDEARALSEVPFGRLSPRLQGIVRARFEALGGKGEGA